MYVLVLGTTLKDYNTRMLRVCKHRYDDNYDYVDDDYEDDDGDYYYYL